MERNVEDIAWDFIVASSIVPNIGEDNKLNYFLGGSVTTLALIGAEEIQDIYIDENGELSGYGETHIIDDKSNEILRKFRRKAGDVDVFQVEKRERIPLSKYQDLLPNDLDNLFSNGRKYPKTDYASDILEGIPTYLVKVKKGDKEIIIPSPVDMVSAKISQCLTVLKLINKAENNQISSKWMNSEEERIQRNKEILKKNTEDFSKKLKDLIILMTYTKTIYPNDYIANRVFEVVKSKNGDFKFMGRLIDSIEDQELTGILKQVISKAEAKEI